MGLGVGVGSMVGDGVAVGSIVGDGVGVGSMAGEGVTVGSSEPQANGDARRSITRTSPSKVTHLAICLPVIIFTPWLSLSRKG